MGFPELKALYEVTFKIPLTVEPSENSFLSAHCPAALMPDGRILTWKDIDPADVEEAVAHELVHRLLEATEISSYEPDIIALADAHQLDLFEDIIELDEIRERREDLSCYLNGAVSHSRLVAILQEHGIGSSKHLLELSKVIKDIDAWIQEYPVSETYHYLGLILFDLHETAPSPEIAKILQKNEEVRRCFNAACQNLAPITRGECKAFEEQYGHVQSFLRTLGYGPKILKQRPPGIQVG